VKPLSHTQAPSTHDAPPVQAFPHAPQWSLLVVTSTQTAPQLTSPAAHVHTPPTQSLPPVHTFLQAPQLLLLVCVSMHDALHSV
jgi:hypothetical protein